MDLFISVSVLFLRLVMYKDVDGKHDDLDGQSSSLWTVAEAGKSILDFVNKT